MYKPVLFSEDYLRALKREFERTPSKEFSRGEIYVVLLEHFIEYIRLEQKAKREISDSQLIYAIEMQAAGREWLISGRRTIYDLSQAKMEASKIHYIAVEKAQSLNINPRTLQQNMFDKSNENGEND